MPILVAVLAGFAVSQLATLATTVWLHRALAHRALNVRGPLTFLFRFVVWVTTGMRPREWVAVHRKHHAFTDTEQDPHSPVQVGVLRVQFANAAMYRRVARDRATVDRYAKDLAPDRWDRVLFDRGWLGLALGITFLILVLGPFYGLLAAAFHMAFYLWMSGAVNALAHHFGRRPYPNSATNLQWLAFLSGGEGLHNNHHAAPTSARFSLHRGEIDLGWFAIRVFRVLRQVTVRLDKVKLSAAAAASTGNEPR